MKTFLLGLLLAVSFSAQSHAKQLELPLQHPDEVLAAAHYKASNLRLAFSNTMPKAVIETLNQVDLAFEAGDGYYNHKASATYAVLDTNGNIAGYMEVALLSYTEDPIYAVVAAYVTPQGRRLNLEIWMDSFDTDDSEAIAQLPPELRPDDFEE